MNQKLYLLDGMALIYRAHFAFIQNPRITSYGLNTSAVFGMANTILDVLRNENPTHLAVVFDTPEPTERHEMFEAYKAHRDEMPEDLSKAIPYVFQLLQGMNIPVITKPGYEADDIIATLALQAKEKGWKAFIMSPDKDLAQVIEEGIFLHRPGRTGQEKEILGVKEVLERWDIERVEQVADILGLWGDAVDNIPGVPGVGEKTAKALIKQFGSVENILENLDQLKGKQKENFENFKEQALLSKKLATIQRDVPVEEKPEQLEVKEFNKPVLEKFLQDLEFRQLAKRIFGEPTPVAVQTDLFGQVISAQPITTPQLETEDETQPLKTLAQVEHEYILVNDQKAMAELGQLLFTCQGFCFDTETTSIEPVWAELVGLSFSIEPGKAYYIPVPDQKSHVIEILSYFKDAFENPKIYKIGQNLKYDIIVLQHYGIHIQGALEDTMLAHYLLEPDMRHNMDFMSQIYLQYQPISITELIGKKGVNQLNFRQVDLQKAKDYAAEDADITLQLSHILIPKLKEQGIDKLYKDVEIPLIHVLADIENTGVKIDAEFLKTYSQQLEKEAQDAEKNVYRCAGLTFNLASPKQLGEVLFEHLKLDPKAKKTKTGQYKTDEEVLQGLSQHEIVQYILEFRQIVKLKSTYVDALPDLIHPKTGRVHTSYNQAVAATGRLSSQNPNLQNIPIKTDRGKEIRKAFIPENEEYQILSADYSQIELRLIASMSGDENMKKAFVDGHDIHTATAANIYKIPLEEVSKDMRRNAKSVNFGIVYGISAFGLSQNLGIPRKEAAEIIDSYFQTYPGIRKYMDQTIAFAREHGYVETILGRRRYLRDILSANAVSRGFAERNAINAPIQGSAADMIKVAMIQIHQKMKGMRSRMIMQVHDELVFDAHHSELSKLKEMVTDTMEKAMPLEVPVIAECGLGNNWLEAH